MVTTVAAVVAGNKITATWGNTVSTAVGELQALNPVAGSYTPSLTNVAIGTGGSAGVSGLWRYANGLLHLRIGITLGTSGFSVTGVPGVPLPAGFTQDGGDTATFIGGGLSLNAAGSLYYGLVAWGSATSINFYVANAASTYLARTSISATVPGTWAAGDSMRFHGVLSGTF